jgi:hypothetical protein
MSLSKVASIFFLVLLAHASVFSMENVDVVKRTNSILGLNIYESDLSFDKYAGTDIAINNTKAAITRYFEVCKENGHENIILIPFGSVGHENFFNIAMRAWKDVFAVDPYLQKNHRFRVAITEQNVDNVTTMTNLLDKQSEVIKAGFFVKRVEAVGMVLQHIYELKSLEKDANGKFALLTPAQGFLREAIQFSEENIHWTQSDINQ